MKSAKRGRLTSVVEVVHVSAHGFWLFLEPPGRELFLPFGSFPWFADATIRQLSTVVVERGHVVRWPELDVDLDVRRIEDPERYPLVSRQPAARPIGLGRRRAAPRSSGDLPRPSRSRGVGRAARSG
jgi:hypothetical protein